MQESYPSISEINKYGYNDSMVEKAQKFKNRVKQGLRPRYNDLKGFFFSE